MASKSTTIAAKMAANAYTHVADLAADVARAADAALLELSESSTGGPENTKTAKAVTRVAEFKAKALDIVRREKAYPNAAPEATDGEDSKSASQNSQAILSVVGYAPQERRLFSSLPISSDVDVTEFNLPPGVSFSRIVPSGQQEAVHTIGEVFGAPRPLPPLQPPKQPSTQAKGNMLDFYHPELAETAKYRGNCYFNTKLSAGHYLDYSNATPPSQSITKQRERAQSLAGKKPSTTELAMSEMESLFRGAFSSFAPSKDDSSAVVPSGLAGRMWWQKSRSHSLQHMVEVEYYEDISSANVFKDTDEVVELDEAGVREAIDNWDDNAVDPSLEDAMGTKKDEADKEVDDILGEVTDLIETLASYQRIRNLTLPNSHNRQSSDPVTGDMLATSGPQPSEDEQATYEVLKAQLALIIKTLPPYAVAKLNGDQLDDLLISSKVQVQTDQYNGVMEEDDAGVQARIRAQQQAAAQAAQARPNAPRAASISTPYANQYQQAGQYATPSRTPSHPQQYFRNMGTPNYQQQRNVSSPVQQHQRPPQPNQYTRPNGFPNQYATQLAKAQTPYGHQNMPQYANQQRPPHSQMQQGTPNTRYNFQPGFQGTPAQSANHASFANGMPPRNMSPQMPQQRHQQQFSPSPNMQQAQRFSTSGQPNQHNRQGSNPGHFSQSPGLTGYHTVIPEAQQQRILDQAKARVAAQERSAMFGDKMGHPGMPGMGYTGSIDASRIAAARANLMSQQKPQTPVGQMQRPGLNGSPAPQGSPPPAQQHSPVSNSEP